MLRDSDIEHLESTNRVIKGIRRLPICAIVQLTFDCVVGYFNEQYTKAQGMAVAGNDWLTWAEQDLCRCGIQINWTQCAVV